MSVGSVINTTGSESFDLCDEILGSRKGSEKADIDDGEIVLGDEDSHNSDALNQKDINTTHLDVGDDKYSVCNKYSDSEFDVVQPTSLSDTAKPADEIEQSPVPPIKNPSAPVQSWLNRLANAGSEASSDGDARVFESDDESFDLLSPMASLSLKSVPSYTDSGSISSFAQAQESIDAFFNNQQSYTSKQENKLRFWQSLCIVFGLVDVGFNSTPYFASLSSIGEDTEVDGVSDLFYPTACTPSTKKSKGKGKKGKGRKALPPIPTSLCQARLLLNSKAHVNIVDLMHAQRNWKKAITGNQPQSLAYLLHPSVRALVEYTMEEGKFVKKIAKNEWLQPLLRGMETSGYRSYN